MDDDDRLRDVLSVYIQYEDGLEVAGTAHDAQEALAMVIELLPDAIVLDYHMPGLNGLEALPLLREAAPKARIVMFTADDDTNASQAALNRGADGFITKNGQKGLDDVMALLHTA